MAAQSVGSIGDENNTPLDALSLVHFSSFFVMGLLVKNHFLVALLLGIVWEFVEHAIVHFGPTRALLLRYWPIPPRHWDEKIENKIVDIFVNMCGYALGNYINF